jgi:hypothetical protein
MSTVFSGVRTVILYTTETNVSIRLHAFVITRERLQHAQSPTLSLYKRYYYSVSTTLVMVRHILTVISFCTGNFVTKMLVTNTSIYFTTVGITVNYGD